MNNKPKSIFKRKKVMLSAFVMFGALAGPGAPGIAQAQTLSCPSGLDFGQLTTCGVANTATITTNGSRNVTGCLSAGAYPYHGGLCTVTIPTLPFTFQVSITATQYALSNGGGDTMVVDQFKCFASSGACNQTLATFFATIPIGARLNVQNPQASGTYSGNFTFNVIYP